MGAQCLVVMTGGKGRPYPPVRLLSSRGARWKEEDGNINARGKRQALGCLHVSI